VKRDGIGRSALQLARVLDEDHPFVPDSKLGEKRVGERGLARAGAARNEQVAALDDRQRKQPRRLRRHDAVVHIVEKRIDTAGGLSDGKAGSRHHRREKSLEALARLSLAMGRELGADDWRCRMRFSAGITWLSARAAAISGPMAVASIARRRAAASAALIGRTPARYRPWTRGGPSEARKQIAAAIRCLVQPVGGGDRR